MLQSQVDNLQDRRDRGGITGCPLRSYGGHFVSTVSCMLENRMVGPRMVWRKIVPKSSICCCSASGNKGVRAKWCHLLLWLGNPVSMLPKRYCLEAHTNPRMDPHCKFHCSAVRFRLSLDVLSSPEIGKCVATGPSFLTCKGGFLCWHDLAG
jgi:hypothetical protein